MEVFFMETRQRKRKFLNLGHVEEFLMCRGGDLNDLKELIRVRWPHVEEVRVARRTHGEVFIRPRGAPRGEWIDRFERRKLWRWLGEKIEEYTRSPLWPLVKVFGRERATRWLVEYLGRSDILVGSFGDAYKEHRHEDGRRDWEPLSKEERGRFFLWVTHEKLTLAQKGKLADWLELHRSFANEHEFKERGFDHETAAD